MQVSLKAIFVAEASRLTSSVGQTLQRPEEQAALVEILEKAIITCKFAPKTLVDDLRKIWKVSASVLG